MAAALASLKDTVKLPWLSSTTRRSGSIPQPSLPGATHAQPVSNEELNEPARKHVIEAGTPPKLGSWRLATITRAKSPSPRVAGLHTDTKSIPGASETQIDDSPPVTRVLSWKHFETALLEISPSSTEDGTLPELRKVGFTARVPANGRSGPSNSVMAGPSGLRGKGLEKGSVSAL